MSKDLKPIQKLIYEIRDKFPESFMFQLSPVEWENLRSQFVTFKNDIRKFKPYTFTEHGVLMLSNVLRSKRATAISIQIVEAFVKLRDYALSQVGTNEQIAELRRLLMLHIENTDNKLSEHDEAISQIIQALNNLIEKPPKSKPIGFISST